MKRITRKILMGFFSAVLLISNTMQPITQVMAESETDTMYTTEAEEEFEEAPAPAATASDLEVDADSGFDITRDFAHILLPVEADVIFKDAKDQEGNAFSLDRAGEYTATYTIVPRNTAAAAYDISCRIVVRARETQVDNAVSSPSDEESDDEADDPGALYTDYSFRRGTRYYYNTSSYTLGDSSNYSTYQYIFEYNNVTQYAYCIQPRKDGPQGNLGYTPTTLGNGDLVAKVLYYGADAENPANSPAGSQGFFQQKYPDLPAGARYVITHITAAKANGDRDWDHKTNATAKRYANELIAYASSQSAIPSAAISVSYSGNAQIKDGRQLSNIITVNADAGQSTTFTLPAGMSLADASSTVSVNGQNVTVKGTGSFRISAPLNASMAEISVRATGSVTANYSAIRFDPNAAANATQVLGFLTVSSSNNSHSATFTPGWAQVNVRVQKVDAEDQKALSNAVFDVYADKACTNHIDTITTNGNGVAESKLFYPSSATVYVKELTAPEGYVLDTTVHAISVDGKTNGGTASITIGNTMYKGSVSFTKQGETISGVHKDSQGNLVFEYAAAGLAGTEYAVFAHKDIVVGGKTIYKADAEVTRVTTDANGNATAQGLPVGEYYLQETKAAPGYVLNPEKHVFTIVNEKAKVQIAQAFNNNRVKTRLLILKRDAETGAVLQGAEFGLYAGQNFTNAAGKVIVAKDTLIAKGTSDANGSIDFSASNLPVGSYYVKELQAPNGYVPNDTATAAVVGTDSQTVTLVEKTIVVGNLISKLEINKIDEGNKPLAGSVLQLFKVTDGKEVAVGDAWTTDGTARVFAGLEAGSYVLKELTPTPGYTKAKDIAFEVTNLKSVQAVSMVNLATKVKISKVDITKEEELPGNKLAVYTEDGKLVEEWISGDKPHMIEAKLEAGKTYVLKELSAADGYSRAESITFTVNTDGTVQTVVMKNRLTKVEVSKTDKDGNLIPDCELEIRDANGKQIAKWTTGDKPYVIQGLAVGTYILAETKPAPGFATARNIEFTVTDELTTHSITMVDDTTKVSISKTDITGEKEVPGCVLRLEDLEGNLVHEWTSTDEPYVFENRLIAGNTYVLSEIRPADGYVTAESITFKVKDTGEIQKVVMKDDVTKVMISKVDITSGEELPGCEMKLEDTEGNIIQEWTTTDKPYYFENSLVAGKEYVLTETRPADGFTTAESITFKVADTGEIQKVVMKDDVTKVMISKVDITDGEELPGCEMKLEDKEGNLIETWISGDEPYFFENRLVAGKTYILSETRPADGYATAESIEFTVSDTGEIQKVEMVDDFTKVYISKVDITNGKELPGCSLKLEDAAGNLIEEWISSDEPYYFENRLVAGKEYVLIETRPADGFTTAEVVRFKVKDTGEIQKVVMKDDVTKVMISKVDITNGKELPGCEMKLEDEDGNLIEKWISSDEPYFFENTLVAGKKYILTETRPADGYVTAESITFTVSDTSEIQKVEMVDDTTKVQISKVDITNGEEIPGCDMKLEDADGNLIEEWTTTDEPHYFENKLVAGKKYVLIETRPADGYATAEVVRFKVKDTGEIQKVVMKDDVTKIYISKVDITNGEELPGCNMKLEDEDGNIIEEWTTTDKPYIFENRLVAGKKYILSETRPADGYVTAESIEFTVSDTSEIQKVEMVDDFTKVYISKVDITNGKELPNCNLKLEDADGNLIEEWTTTDEPHYFENKLVAGKEYVLIETRPADGYATAEVVRFKVKDTGEIQKVVMKDDVTKVMISKVDITNGKELPGCEMKLEDEDGNLIEKWISSDEPYFFENRLVAGKKYILTETRPADGYVTAESIKFTVSDTSEIQKVEMVDDVTKVQISKVDMTTGKELPNCNLKLEDADGNLIEEWTTTDKPYYFENRLVAGQEYVLIETRPADGYSTAEVVRFKVKDTGEIQKVVMKDDVTKIYISKVDITNGEEIPGCEMKLEDEDGNIIEEWTTTDKPYIFENRLVAGKKYILTETRPADGYVTAESIEFTVSDTSEIQKVEMVDDVTKVQISKVDMTTGKELPNCNLKLEDADGNLIEEWTTTDKPYYFENKLVAGKEYVLIETRPADGYSTAEIVRFTVKDTGEIQKVVMKDDVTKIYISKVDITNGEEIPGCEMKLEDEDGNIIEEWTTTDKPYIFENRLVAGKKYILSETRPADGYVTAESIEFTVSDTSVIQKVEMVDDITKVKIQKVDEEGNPLEGAVLQLQDANGEVIREWTSGMEAERFEKLPFGEYTLSEISAPNGYELARDIVFEVTDSAELVTIVMTDKRKPMLPDQPDDDAGDDGDEEDDGDKEDTPDKPMLPDHPEKPETPEGDDDAGSENPDKPGNGNTSSSKPGSQVSTAARFAAKVWYVLLAGSLAAVAAVLFILKKKRQA